MRSRALVRLVLASMLLSILAACTAAPARSISFMVFGDAAERNAYQALVTAFEQIHPEIRVELIHIPSQQDYRTRLITDFAAGQPPDVSLLNYRRYPRFAASDALEPLGPYLDRSSIINASQFYPAALEAFTYNGTLVCIPQNISSLVVYYNKDLFAASGVPEPGDGWTWEQFVATARALTRDLNNDGVTDQYGLGLEPSFYRATPFIWQNGGALVDDEAEPSRLALTRFPAQQALQWFVDLQLVHHVVPDRVAEAAQDSESRFLAGTTAMYLNSRRGVPSYRAISAFRWDIAPLPRGAQRAGILHTDGYCLAQATRDKPAAWMFIEFANSVPGQQIVAQSGRTVPSLRSVAESPAFLDPSLPPSRSQVFLDAIADLRRVPLLPNWEEIERIAGEEIERAFYGDIPVAEAARLAVERTEEYFPVR